MSRPDLPPPARPSAGILRVRLAGLVIGAGALLLTTPSVLASDS